MLKKIREVREFREIKEVKEVEKFSDNAVAAKAACSLRYPRRRNSARTMPVAIATLSDSEVERVAG